MQMVGMEALVALKYRLPIVFAVFNDARYNMVYHGYRQVFGREAEWESPWTDFAAWARSMGMAGLRVNHPGEITTEQLARLRGTRVPVVLDIRIDRDVKLNRRRADNEALQLHVDDQQGERLVHARIAGLGLWFPERVRSNADWPERSAPRAA